MTGGKSRPTIRAVAREAGVSMSMVSRVMNNRAGVDEQKRSLILDVVKRLGYQPSPSARRLSLGTVSRVGFNVGVGSGLIPFNVLLRDHLTEVLAQQGLFVEVIRSNPMGLPEHLADAMVIGSVIDDDPRIPHLLEAEVPFVVYGKHPGTFSVSSDDYLGGRLAAEHLLRLGHTDFLFVSAVRHGADSQTGSRYTHMSQERFEGFNDALHAANIGLPPSHVVDGTFTALGAFLAVRAALNAGLEFTAVFAISDRMAHGAIAAIEDGGLSVPRDVSVIGYDDEPGQLNPLSTIHQGIEELAHRIGDLLQEAIEGEMPRQCVVPVRLVPRNTTARRRR